MNEEQKKEALTCKYRRSAGGWWEPPCVPESMGEEFPPYEVVNWLFCPFCGASIEFEEEA